MKISVDTATSLGEKLASLDLSEEEAALLAVLLQDEPDDEVSGFSFDKRPDVELRPIVRGPVEKNWSWGASQWSWGKSQDGYTEVEWTY